jgi:hypothetical protein
MSEIGPCGREALSGFNRAVFAEGAVAEETEQLIGPEPTPAHPTRGSRVGPRPATARSRAGHGPRR